ncbi:MAG TPA: phosphopentomutase [candidate division WOR-3 bacterium]|uniref:Phosphopentomutase n=1 Tax=candidate division WOR-3 bacterium TaxID=2052148 RepID=A0A7V0XEQ4_UNCW3|nr:phosphopentomutase [candidate division WOR-3 bacterium]
MLSHRAVVLVLDGVGCGELPDAASYGDAGSNTLGNLARAVGGLRLPNLGRLGLGHITDILGVPPASRPAGGHGRMAEASAGKDSTTGHWELAGLVTDRPFDRFPGGFPAEFIRRFEAAIGRTTLGNVAESGTAIIARLGDEHLRTGRPIVYTSADSVFQVAAHEEVIPVEELYRICAVARRMLDREARVGRVIARPFTGRDGEYRRTPRRRDFSLPPHGPTLLDRAREAGHPVVVIGKVDELFAGQGFTESHHTVDNDAALDATLAALGRLDSGLVFVNLVQFDMDWGHRNDPAGFARGLEAFDARLPEVLERLRPGDLLFLTADHGNDPTTASTDHSREYVPLLCVGPGVRPGVDLGTRPTFADLGRTAAAHLGVRPLKHGRSFIELITEVHP